MAKYKVLHRDVALPYYPDNDKGAPLPASQSSEENAAKDEYGRAKVGHLIYPQGKEFYAGENAGDDLFYTHDTNAVERYLYYGAIEEVGGEEAKVQQEEEPKPKARAKKSDNKEE